MSSIFSAQSFLMSAGPDGGYNHVTASSTDPAVLGKQKLNNLRLLLIIC